ncbi:MAG TPA: hypothetical protein VNU01_01460 [Egibacteraceae bacterium]|nr:hypothetical protein [Egibacteraceae bacterium]
MRRRLPATVSALAMAAAVAGCSGGDSSPEDAAGGGIPPQSSVEPRTNIGQSEGFPDAGAQQEATTDE